MNNLNDMMAMFAGVSMGVYLIAVVFQGNTQAFVSAIMTESGYLQFVVAIFVLMVIHTYLPGGPVTDLITLTAILGAVLLAVGNVNIADALKAFGTGQATMWQTITSIFGSNAPIVGNTSVVQ